MKGSPEVAFNFKRFIQDINLPERTGVYKMIGGSGEVLYIGKAINLRKRILSYSRATNIRIFQMVKLVRQIEIVETKNEAEALMLEAILIKKIQPFYNVLLKDDRSFPYIIMTKHKFPRIKSERGEILEDLEKEENLMQFGPFLKASALRRMIQTL